MNRRGSILIALVMIVLLLAATSAFIYFYRAARAPKEAEVIVNVTSVAGYPLRFRSGANESLHYRLLNSSGVVIGEGDALPGVIETYTNTLLNETYELQVKGPSYYYESFRCRQENPLRVCQLTPQRIAKLELWNDGPSYFIVDAGEGLVKRAGLCVTWGSRTLNVEVLNASFLPVPQRLFGVVDRCYFINDITGKRVFNFHVLRTGSEQENITFRFIDYEVDEQLQYTYEEHRGMQDISIVLVR